MKLKKLIDDLKLSVEAKGEIDRILSLPEVEAVFEREDASRLAHRTELRKRLTLVPAQRRRSLEAASAAAQAATKRVRELADALDQAKRAEAAALVASYAASLSERTEACKIMDELYAGRDRRLDDLRFQVSQAEGKVQVSLKMWLEDVGGRFGPSRYGSNIETVRQALVDLRALRDEVIDLCHAAISRSDTTDAMRRICSKMQAALGSLRIIGPEIDEHGEVIAPKPVVLREVA